jgi:hypothetical protein
MIPNRRADRGPPPGADEENIDGVAGPPVYHMPMPEVVTRVEPVAADEWIIGVAGPPMNPEQAKAWREARRGKPKRDPNRLLIPTEDEIARLPRWARVAFAARCARRVLPLFRHHWVADHRFERTRGAEVLADLVAGVECAERAAARAQADATTSAPVAAHRAAGVFQSSGKLLETRQDAGLRQMAVLFANTAQWALDSAGPDPSRRGLWTAVSLVRVLFDFTTLGTARIVTCPARDLDRLIRLAKERNWNDDTPVPPEVFGPMWDRDPPPWWRDDVLADLLPRQEMKNPDPANAGPGSG